MDQIRTKQQSGRHFGDDPSGTHCECPKIRKYVCHSKRVLNIALKLGWRSGARYTNLRDVKHLGSPEFLDIDWQNYHFERHLEVAKAHKPKITVARDIVDEDQLATVLREADELLEHSESVIIVPKAKALATNLEALVPKRFIFGYSVPTKYGGTEIPVQAFRRSVHLLGGRPDVQRHLASRLKVVSMDCNRFTYDARFGDYFNGTRFVPHPVGGYDNCIVDSVKNITSLWVNYCACSV